MTTDRPPATLATARGYSSNGPCATVTPVDRYKEALTPSEDTKAAYWGEFSFYRTYIDDTGNEVAVKEHVPWTTIKEIMKVISERAES